MNDEELNQWCAKIAERIDEEERKMQKYYEPLYDAINLSNKYYEEIVSVIGEPQNEEEKKELSKIANKLAAFSVSNDVDLKIGIRKLND